jgi:hypothetical protein
MFRYAQALAVLRQTGLLAALPGAPRGGLPPLQRACRVAASSSAPDSRRHAHQAIPRQQEGMRALYWTRGATMVRARGWALAVTLASFWEMGVTGHILVAVQRSGPMLAANARALGTTRPYAKATQGAGLARVGAFCFSSLFRR